MTLQNQYPDGPMTKSTFQNNFEWDGITSYLGLSTNNRPDSESDHGIALVSVMCWILELGLNGSRVAHVACSSQLDGSVSTTTRAVLSQLLTPPCQHTVLDDPESSGIP